MSDLFTEYNKKTTNDMFAKYEKEFGITPTLPEVSEQPAKVETLPPQVVEKEDGGFISAVTDFLKELPQQAISGVGDAINNTLETAKDVGKAMGIPDVGLQITNDKGELDVGFYGTEDSASGRSAKVVPVADAAQTEAAGVVRSLVEFATGFVPAAKGVKALGVTGSLAKNTVASGLSAAVAADPDGVRLSTMLNQVPVLNAIIPDYLADTNPENEGIWEKRMKNGLDMLVVGGATDALVGSVVKMIKMYKVKNVATASNPVKNLTPEAAVKEADAFMAAKASSDNIISPIAETAEKVSLKTGKGEVFINMDRVDALDEVKAMMQKTANEAIDPTTGAKTFEGIKAASKEELGSVESLLGRKIDRPFTAEEAVAAREIMTASAERLTELAKAASSITRSPESQFAFRQALALHNDIQQVVLAGRKATAQSLGSWRITAGSGDRAKQISAMLEGKGKSIDEMAKAITDVAERNPEGISAVAGKLADPTWGDAVYQVWVNGLLSGPTTHMANAVGNMGTTVMGLGEKYISVGFATMRGEGGAALKEANASAMGFFSGLKDSWKLLKQADPAYAGGSKVEKGVSSAISSKLVGAAPDSIIGKGMDYLGQAIDAPGWCLEKGDNLFKGLNYRMELSARATRQALDEGLVGKELSERVADLVKNPTDPIKEIAGDFARYQTFQTPTGAFGQWVQKGQSIGGMRYVMPFVRTPINIFKYGLERTPAGLAFPEVRAALKAGGPERDAALAKLAGGSLIMGGASSMALEGKLSGAGPTNPNERKALLATGWQPYSVKMGDTWVSYARLEPIGSLLGYAADMGSIMGGLESDEDADNLVATGLAAFSKQLMNKTFVSGAMRALDAIGSGNDKVIGRWMQDTATTFAPYSALGKTVHKYTDDVKRDYRPDGEMGLLRQTMEKYKENFGILSTDAPPLRDVWGQELHSNNGIYPMLENMSPIAVKKDDPDPVNRMIAERKISVSMPARTMQGVKLTNKEYSEFSRIAGEQGKMVMDKLVAAGRFDGLSDELTQQMVGEVMTKAREYAKAKLVRGNLDLMERIKQSKIETNQKLRGTN